MALQLSASVRDSFLAGRDVVCAVRIKINDTNYFFAEAAIEGYESGATVQYKPWLKGVTAINYSVPWVQWNIQVPSTTITFLDKDKVLQRAFEGADRHHVVGAPVEVWWAADVVDDWTPVFAGIVEGHPSYKAPDMVSFSCRFDDRALYGNIKAVKLTPEIFPNADEESYNTTIPYVYGRNYSTNTGEDGSLLATFCSDSGDPNDATYGYRYVVASQHLYDGNVNVWKSGVLQTISTHYAVKHVVRAGRRFTEIGFTADPRPDDITVDIDGMTYYSDHIANSPVEADLIDGPGEALVHLLTNFGYMDAGNRVVNESAVGIWDGWYDPDTYSSLAQASFLSLDSLLSQKNRRASIVVGQDSIMSTIQEWCLSHSCWLKWNPDGTLAPLLLDPYRDDPYLDNNSIAQWPWLRPSHWLNVPTLDSKQDNLYGRIESDWMMVENGSRYVRKTVIGNPDAAAPSEESVQLPWAERDIS